MRSLVQKRTSMCRKSLSFPFHCTMRVLDIPLRSTNMFNIWYHILYITLQMDAFQALGSKEVTFENCASA